MLRFGGEMKILPKSRLDMVLLLRYLLRSDDEMKFLLKSGLGVVVLIFDLAKIWWL